MTRIVKNLTAGALVCVALLIGGCGAEAPVDADETLSADESAALEEEYTIEAIETIDENNAEAELQKLTQEIEADQ
ncbi:MAG: hypothetical protein JXX14_00595 [Deltaproteobacteria bacterium]|nr:hypothetical protein [Deltaproteobacteria bacterium]